MSKRRFRRQRGKAFEAPSAAEPSQRLFHYTTSQGLAGILNSRSLFATHYNFLNDTTEVSLIRDILTPYIEKQFHELMPQLVQIGAIKQGLYDEHGRSIHRTEAANVISSITRAAAKLAPFYIASFCRHSIGSHEYQNGLLSQWRHYGRGGFAIEIDEEELDQALFGENGEGSRFHYDVLSTNEVRYSDHEEFVEPAQFDGIAKSLMKTAIPFSQNVAILRDAPDMLKFVDPFLRKAPFLKHAAFTEEREYRIAAAAAHIKTINDRSKEKQIKPVNFRDGPSGLTPYINLFEASDQSLPIKAILVGPHPNQSSQQIAVELMLAQYGLDVPIRLADAPLR